MKERNLFRILFLCFISLFLFCACEIVTDEFSIICDKDGKNCNFYEYNYDKQNGNSSSNNDDLYGKLEITSVEHKASFVTVHATSESADNKISGYYFSVDDKIPTGYEDNWVNKSTNTLEIAVLPGNYNVYVKDEQNNISDPVSLIITYDELYNDGPKSRDVKAPILTTKLTDFLKSKNDSISNLNDFVAWSVKSAGLFTKEGVATASISASNYLFIKYGVNIPYISNHKCFIQRYNTSFGANPKWGIPITLSMIDYSVRNEVKEEEIESYCLGAYGGIDCQAFVGWAVHNGGFKAEDTYASYPGSKVIKACNRYGKNSSGEDVCESLKNYDTLVDTIYKKAEIGDIIIKDGHVRLIIGTFSNGIYVYEGTRPVGMGKYTYKDLYNEKYYGLTKMEGYYKDNHACLKNLSGAEISLPKAYEDKRSEFRTDCTS